MLAPVYDAIRNFFMLAMHAGEPVPCVFADPDEAHEEIKRFMASRAVHEPTAAQTPLAMSNRPTPVPFMSVFVQPDKLDPKYYNPGRVIVSKDTDTGVAVVMRHPRPVTADVQVDLWCGTGGHTIADAVSHQIDLRFTSDRVYLPIDWSDSRWYRPPFDVLEHARVLGRTKIRLLSDSWTDTTELERGVGRKEVRRTWSGRMETYLPYPPIESRLALQVRIDLYDNTTSPPTLLESDVAQPEG